MARTKDSRGLDYFSLDTDWDKKGKLIRMKFGMVGIGVMVTLYQTIYGNDCYISWDEDAQLLFSASVQVDLQRIKEIIAYAVEKDIFDGRILAEKGVLTSHGIQKHWKAVVTKAGRRDCSIPNDINLLSGNYQESESVRSPYAERTLAYADKAKAKVKAKEEQQQANTTTLQSDLDKPDLPARSPALALEVLRKKILGTGIPLSLSDLELGKIARRFEDAEVREDELDPLIAYLADRTRREAKKNLAGLFKKALLEYDWISAFRDERPKPAEAAVTTYPPPPECCDWAEVRTTHPGNRGRCTECGAVWSFEHKLGVWVKDSDEKKLENTG